MKPQALALALALLATVVSDASAAPWRRVFPFWAGRAEIARAETNRVSDNGPWHRFGFRPAFAPAISRPKEAGSPWPGSNAPAASSAPLPSAGTVRRDTANTASVEQFGNRDSGAISQFGSGDHSGIYQFGSNDHATISQRGSNDTAYTLQFGDNLNADTTQVGDAKTNIVVQGKAPN